MSSAHPRLTLETAEAIAAQALAFLTDDPARLSRFLALTGLTLDRVRSRAHTREVLCAVLDHLAGDESLLLTFAANASLPPEQIARALALLERPPGATAGP
jgi:hypothetical protein